jgi:hypothetical protein
MATEGHNHGQGNERKKKRKPKMEKEIEEIRAELDNLTLKMQQEAHVCWRYEWPMK